MTEPSPLKEDQIAEEQQRFKGSLTGRRSVVGLDKNEKDRPVSSLLATDLHHIEDIEDESPQFHFGSSNNEKGIKRGGGIGITLRVEQDPLGASTTDGASVAM